MLLNSLLQVGGAANRPRRREKSKSRRPALNVSVLRARRVLEASVVLDLLFVAHGPRPRSTNRWNVSKDVEALPKDQSLLGPSLLLLVALGASSTSSYQISI